LQARTRIEAVRDDGGATCWLVLQLQEAQPSQAEQALRQALAERDASVRALVREQDVLAYGISHDLRAPLRAIENFSALLELQSASLDDAGRGHLQRIRAAAARMGGLIEALLDLARVDRAELAPGPV